MKIVSNTNLIAHWRLDLDLGQATQTKSTVCSSQRRLPEIPRDDMQHLMWLLFTNFSQDTSHLSRRHKAIQSISDFLSMLFKTSSASTPSLSLFYACLSNNINVYYFYVYYFIKRLSFSSNYLTFLCSNPSPVPWGSILNTLWTKIMYVNPAAKPKSWSWPKTWKK